MPPLKKKSQEENGHAYWRSLRELADSEEFAESIRGEFPAGADLPPDSGSRRRFLQLMAASVSLAGLSGCRWPKENIRPHAKRTDGRMPGESVYYATSMDVGGYSEGLLVKSYDGRPIKVEGNELHPINQGASGIRAQSSVLDLYDPDRAQFPRRNDGGEYTRVSWEEADAFLAEMKSGLASNGGAGFRVLAEASSSVTLDAAKKRLLSKYPQARWVEYEAVSRDTEREGTAIAFGAPHRPLYDLSHAAVILDLEADLLGGHPAALANARGYAALRDPEAHTINRLYSVESSFSATGATADHRFPMASSLIAGFVGGLASALIQEGVRFGAGHDAVAKAAKTLQGTGEVESFVGPIARDLLKNKGRAVVAAGPTQPAEVHALVAAINEGLGNVGATVRYIADPNPERPGHLQAISELAEEMNTGVVNTLLILGGNPVFDAPADVGFLDGLSRVGVSIHLTDYNNETSGACSGSVPRAHYLEAWGDTRAYDGTLTCQQPLIHPLYDGESAIELISRLADDGPRSGYDQVREAVAQANATLKSEEGWRLFLDQGIEKNNSTRAANPRLNASSIGAGLSSVAARGEGLSESSLEAVFVPHPSIYDGRFCNNGWLQEVPEFITKLTWDNALLLAPATADKLGIAHEDLVTVKVGDRSLDAPVYVQPGQAENSIQITLGHGRTAAGRVGNGVGFNSYALRASDAANVAVGVTLAKTGREFAFACTQDHYAIDEVGKEGTKARLDNLVKETDIENYLHHPEHWDTAHSHHPPLESLWTEHSYEEHKWGMSIDLNKCVGCNGCVVACQSENNIPVVGKEQVALGREMHWIRLDRYYRGEPANPTVAQQPLTCHHCENAPCEQVCPVGATTHDSEGLNAMVYNRCVGTRYCANNCPYKVRRFNFFNNHKGLSDIEAMLFNPDVTVRSRGVMEKCTFCTQRIQEVKIDARNDGESIPDGAIKTACQQACPTKAIVFGDLNDTESRVAKLHSDHRAYTVLEELNIKPRTRYLARLRNPNPELGEEA